MIEKLENEAKNDIEEYKKLSIIQHLKIRLGVMEKMEIEIKEKESKLLEKKEQYEKEKRELDANNSLIYKILDQDIRETNDDYWK